MLKDVTKKSYEKPCLETVSIVSENNIAVVTISNTTQVSPTQLSYNTIKDYWYFRCRVLIKVNFDIT